MGGRDENANLLNTAPSQEAFRSSPRFESFQQKVLLALLPPRNLQVSGALSSGTGGEDQIHISYYKS